MRKLLSAQYARLMKNKVFWLGIFVMFGMGLYSFLMLYMDNTRYNEHHLFDDVLLNYVVYIGFCTPIFCSLFSGTEYSDGTIRNKLIVGHTRTSIYCSGWLISILAAVFMGLAFLLSYVVFASLFLGAPKASVGSMLFWMFVSLFVITAYVSVFHMLSMLITKKSTSAVICLIGLMVLFALAIMIKGRLDAPEFVQSYSLTVNGVEMSEPQPNPRYLQPEARKVYQFFLELLPSGQSIQIASWDVFHPYLLMLYSAATSAAVTLFGIFSFKKKNIK